MISAVVAAALAITQPSLTANPSFEEGLAGWHGFAAQLGRVERADAPNGRHVARVSADGSRRTYAIDDGPEAVPAAQAGRQYTGSAHVLGTHATAGQEVGIVVRETDRAGGGFRQIGSAEERVRLSGDGFEEVSVSYVAREEGSAVDVYVQRPPGTLVPGDSFFVDHIRLRSEGPQSSSSSIFAAHRLAIDAEPDFAQLATTAARHRFVVLQAWRTDILRGLKRAARDQRSDVKVLMYRNATMMQRPDERTGWFSSCVSTEQAAEHPDWFLRERNGSRVASSSFEFLLGADVGEPGYRQLCRDNILAALDEEPAWDGVFLDDVNSTLSGHRPQGEEGRHETVFERTDDGSLKSLAYEDYRTGTDRPDRTTDEEWESRVEGLLERVAGGIRDRDRLAIANFCCEERNAAWATYLKHLDGGLSEFFVKYPPPTFGSKSLDERASYRGAAGDWSLQLGLADEAERRGKWFLGGVVARPDDERAARWGVANLLLVSQGRSSLQLVGRLPGDRTASGGHAGYYTRESWRPVFDLARELGQPIGPRHEVLLRDEPTGVIRRRFRGGTVLVNPRRSGGERQVELGRPHSGSGLRGVTSVEIGELEGLVLKVDD